MFLEFLPLLSCGLKNCHTSGSNKPQAAVTQGCVIGTFQMNAKYSRTALPTDASLFLLELQRISEESCNLSYVYPNWLLFFALEGFANCICILYFAKRLQNRSMSLLHSPNRWHWAVKELVSEKRHLWTVSQTLIIWETQQQKLDIKWHKWLLEDTIS